MPTMLLQSTGSETNEILYKRKRIGLKSLYRNPALAGRLHHFVLSINGVANAKANPVTGKILVIFDEQKTNETVIENTIFYYMRHASSLQHDNVIPLNDYTFHEEIAMPVAVGTVPSYAPPHQPAPFYTLDAKQTEIMFNTDCRTGLSALTAQERLKEYGLNVLSEKRRKSLLAGFIENLQNFSTKLLLGVSAISFLLGQISNAFAILGIVAAETLLGSLQQYKAEKSVYSLKKLMVEKAKVIRDARTKEIDAKYLVPGDILIVETGDKVPADARIIECTDLRVVEASLTGESAPIEKCAESCSKNTELANHHNMLYTDSSIVSGRGKAIVVKTGMHTEIGKIALMLQNIKTSNTPLQNRMIKFTNKLTKMCVFFCLTFGTLGLLAGRSLAHVLTTGVSFSLGALPESLPALVTVAAAVSVQRIAKRNMIVRKLDAMETLGCANVICCDKTGTLTMNEMTVKSIYTDQCHYEVSGSGYAPEGQITPIETNSLQQDGLDKLLRAGILCNNACLTQSDNKWTVQGNPTEGALLTAAYKMHIDAEQVKKSCPRIKEIPFDSNRRYMTVVVDTPDGTVAYCKGTLDIMLEKCKTIYENGQERLFTATDKEQLRTVGNELAEKALRVLAFAYKNANHKNSDLEQHYVFLGLVGMEDPPRPGVKQAIQKCHKAGIKVVMITGDHKNTAMAIGRNLGVLSDGLTVSGNELDEMTVKELETKITSIQIFARTSPEQKHRIVKALKKSGQVVAMTGDGVNDAPAMKEADIGIAMGHGGSDIAKDVASITLVDDNFSNIVEAIEEGRTVSSNIKSSMRYLLSGSLGETLAIGLAAAFTRSLPLLSIQILWINVICETLTGAPLVIQAPAEDVMLRPPIDKDAPLIDKELRTDIIQRGVGIGTAAFGAFQGALWMGLGVSKARTMAFTTLMATQLVNAYDCLNSRDKLSNRYMNLTAFISAASLLGIIYLPSLNAFFGTVPLKPLDWAFVSSAGLLSST